MDPGENSLWEMSEIVNQISIGKLEALLLWLLKKKIHILEAARVGREAGQRLLEVFST